MNFKKWVKNIQTAGYNGAGTVVIDCSSEEKNPKGYKGHYILQLNMDS